MLLHAHPCFPWLPSDALSACGSSFTRVFMCEGQRDGDNIRGGLALSLFCLRHLDLWEGGKEAG